MFVTEFTGRASIRRRPPDISFTLEAQLVNIVWKMSLPAQPDWIFQVIAFAAGAVVACVVAAAPPVPGAPDAFVGAFCERHALRNAPRPVSDPYLRKLRRVTLDRRPTACYLLPLPAVASRRPRLGPDGVIRFRPFRGVKLRFRQAVLADARRETEGAVLRYLRLEAQGHAVLFPEQGVPGEPDAL